MSIMRDALTVYVVTTDNVARVFWLKLDAMNSFEQASKTAVDDRVTLQAVRLE